uniref:(northern house mosquito) hypothetical protein n=1 Tax=Culex pipiens TaxID=7175 RepID=A0A8D8FJH3_CULPI
MSMLSMLFSMFLKLTRNRQTPLLLASLIWFVRCSSRAMLTVVYQCRTSRTVLFSEQILSRNSTNSSRNSLMFSHVAFDPGPSITTLKVKSGHEDIFSSARSVSRKPFVKFLLNVLPLV